MEGECATVALVGVAVWPSSRGWDAGRCGREGPPLGTRGTWGVGGGKGTGVAGANEGP